MKLARHFLHIAIIAISIQQTTIAAPPIRELIQHVLAATECKRPLKFFQFIDKHYPVADQTHKQERLINLKQMAPTLIHAIILLSDVPGFEGPLSTTLHPACLPTNEHFYELEKAIKITKMGTKSYHVCQASGTFSRETIQRMNPQISIPQEPGPVYFDLMTTFRYIECKAVNWNKNPKESCPITTKLHSQFQRQQKAVLLLNQKNGTSYLYQVHSKNKVPEAWHTWFEQNGISVVEEKG